METLRRSPQEASEQEGTVLQESPLEDVAVLRDLGEEGEFPLLRGLRIRGARC
jgi:hypothetical protein